MGWFWLLYLFAGINPEPVPADTPTRNNKQRLIVRKRTHTHTPCLKYITVLHVSSELDCFCLNYTTHSFKSPYDDYICGSTHFFLLLKGTVSQDFLLFLSKNSTCAPYEQIKPVCNIFLFFVKSLTTLTQCQRSCRNHWLRGHGDGVVNDYVDTMSV